MSQASKDIVMNMWRTFSTRDEGKIRDCFTEDAVWIAPPRNATAIAAGKPDVTRMNRQEIADFIAHDVGRVFTNIQIDFTGLYGEGDVVTLQSRYRATLANGRSYDVDYCWVFKTRDGRVAEMREYMDTLAGFRQIFGEDSVKAGQALIEA